MRRVCCVRGVGGGYGTCQGLKEWAGGGSKCTGRVGAWACGCGDVLSQACTGMGAGSHRFGAFECVHSNPLARANTHTHKSFLVLSNTIHLPPSQSRYMSLVPADTPYLEPPEGRAATAATAAAAAWLRLLRWLSAWRQRRGGGGGGRGGQQQHSGQLPLKQLRRMVAERCGGAGA